MNAEKQLKQISLNELISLASYSIENTTVPAYDKIVEEFSDTWADMYLDEDLKEKEGEHCFIIWDDCNNNIRAIVVSDELDDNAKIKIIDIMDNVIFYLLFPDILDQITNDETIRDTLRLKFDGSYEELLNYIDTNKQSMDNVSEYEYSWLQVLVNNRLDLVTL